MENNGEKKGYPDHLINVIQSLYKNTTVMIEDNCTRNKTKIINKPDSKTGLPSVTSRINSIPRIDTYFFEIHSNIVLPSMPRSS